MKSKLPSKLSFLILKVKERKIPRTRKKQADKGESTNSTEWVEKRKCFSCHKVGPQKKNCPEKKKQDNQQADVAIAEKGYDSAEVLTISDEKLADELLFSYVSQ